MGASESSGEAEGFKWKEILASLAVALLVPGITVFYFSGRLTGTMEQNQASTAQRLDGLQATMDDQKDDLQKALDDQRVELQRVFSDRNQELQRSFEARSDALSVRLNEQERGARVASEAAGRQDERLANLKNAQEAQIGNLRDELDTRGSQRDRQMERMDARLASLEKGQSDDRVQAARIESQLASISAGQVQDRAQMALIQGQLARLLEFLDVPPPASAPTPARRRQ